MKTAPTLSAIRARKPETILIDSEVYILWKDGHESRYSFFTLRDLCPCAKCVDELTGKKVLKPESIPGNIRVFRSEYVGNYAIRFYWSDQHQSGIYTFRHLREQCPCRSCQATNQEE